MIPRKNRTKQPPNLPQPALGTTYTAAALVPVRVEGPDPPPRDGPASSPLVLLVLKGVSLLASA